MLMRCGGQDSNFSFKSCALKKKLSSQAPHQTNISKRKPTIFDIIKKRFIGKKVTVDGFEGILDFCDVLGNLCLTTNEGSVIIQRKNWGCLREVK